MTSSSHASGSTGYHDHAVCVAAETVRSDRFAHGLARVARRLLSSVPRLTVPERQLLQDVIRGRYPMATFCRLMEFSRRSLRPEDRDALAELVQAHTRAARRTVAIASAFDATIAAVGPSALAEREFERHPSLGSAEHCREALTAQYAVTRDALDAVTNAEAAL